MKAANFLTPICLCNTEWLPIWNASLTMSKRYRRALCGKVRAAVEIPRRS